MILKYSSFLKLLIIFTVGQLAWLFFVFSAHAFSSQDVVINEIAWMGTQSSATDEWIELKNNTASSIDITGWSLKSNEATPAPSIILSGTIPAGGYFLLERTNDTTINDISANQIYTGALSNTGEDLDLKDADGNIIDSVYASLMPDAKWPAGDNTTKSSMERIDSTASGNLSSNWTTNNGILINGADASGNLINGTPLSANSASTIPLTTTTLPETTTTISDVSTSTSTTTLPPSTTSSIQQAPVSKKYTAPKTSSTTSLPLDKHTIIINEFLPNAENGQEWVEIINKNNFSVDISNWQIDDGEGNSAPLIIQSPANILPNGLLTIYLDKSKLNNDGDELRLLFTDGQVVHAIEYPKAPANISLARDESGQWAWTLKPTPGTNNIIIEETTSTSIFKQNKTIINTLREKVASLFNPVPPNNNNPEISSTQTSIEITPLRENATEIGSANIAQSTNNTKISSNKTLIFSIAGIIILGIIGGLLIIFLRR